jgi:hypothetical protein
MSARPSDPDSNADFIPCGEWVTGVRCGVLGPTVGPSMLVRPWTHNDTNYIISNTSTYARLSSSLSLRYTQYIAQVENLFKHHMLFAYRSGMIVLRKMSFQTKS